MSDKQFLVTYTGSSVVELEGAGVFGAGVSAFVDAKTADRARKQGDFSVEEGAPAAPQVSTKGAVDAAQQAEAAKASPPPAPAAKPAPAPAAKPAPAKAEAAPKKEAAGAKGGDKKEAAAGKGDEKKPAKA